MSGASAGAGIDQQERERAMALQVDTRDSAALTDADLDEMASMGGAFDIGALSKAKEDWVLSTTCRIDDKLHGFTFSTLERIGVPRRKLVLLGNGIDLARFDPSGVEPEARRELRASIGAGADDGAIGPGPVVGRTVAHGPRAVHRVVGRIDFTRSASSSPLMPGIERSAITTSSACSDRSAGRTRVSFTMSRSCGRR